ncbi:MAG TPA: glycosyltransferase family 4 protein [Nitrospira sp.]|jgi:glycosyltransferase involved in cell wall biosynthesis|nr:glycosyltransferase family 4 protein [Nitrospira sp.]
MRILFLSHYFPPEVNAPASRTYEHCKQWVQEGHEVTVVTCAPNHPQGTVYEGYRNKLIQWENQDGIRVVRIWTYVTANQGFLKRTVNYISFMMAAILSAPFLSGFDITLSTSPQFFNGLAGYAVSRIKRTPWILEIRDLWPESIVAVGAITNRPIIGLLEALELFAYRRADHIVVVTDSFKTHIQDKGICKQRVTVIKNGVDFSLYKKPPDNPVSLAAKIGIEGKFVASYIGTHGMAHHLETILQAADELREWQDIVFLLVGDGAERDRLLAMKDSMNLSNVVMLDQQPKTAMPHFWSLSNVSLVLLRKCDLFKTVIPSKIFESMAMERPIILGVEGESSELLKSAEAGICIEPENEKDLAAQVLNLYQNPRRCQELGLNGRKYVLENFDRLVLAKRFSDLIRNVCRQS